jgi:DNA-binding NarL/FixJ family response regulator
VAIVEDDPEIRSDVASYLKRQKDLSLAFEADSAESMLTALKAAPTAPDVVIMDIGLPGMSGLDAIRLIKDRYPSTDVMMFTVHDDPNKIFAALCNGATGYLLKNTPFDELKTSVMILHAGGAPMSPQIARKVMQFFSRQNVVRSSPLTEKEREVVQGLVDGLSYKMIADRMGITIETVRSYIKKIYSKLQVHSKAEVITMSLRGRI